MRRGFKAAADRHAANLREAIGNTEYQTIDLPRLAQHLKVTVMAADRLLGSLEPLLSLHDEQPGSFSAATFVLPGRTVVIYNPININGQHITPTMALRDGRTRSNIAHEFSHLVLGHEVREVQVIGGHSFFTCNTEQETEANWLAGCLLLPRKLLIAAAYQNVPDEEIADRFHVTPQMAAFRMNTSGARMQAARKRVNQRS